MSAQRPRLFLHQGDHIIHTQHSAWGRGLVVEERHSVIAGGICLARASFEDGEERTFINDLDNAMCCYFSGIRIVE